MGGGGGELCPCQMSILISILLVCHGKFQIRIEEGWLTEPVVFLIGHFIHYKTMSFLFNSVLYFPIIIKWSRKKKGNRCDLKKINYNKVKATFFQFQRSVLFLFAQGVSVQGVYVLGGKCPGGRCPGGICDQLRGKDAPEYGDSIFSGQY